MYEHLSSFIGSCVAHAGAALSLFSTESPVVMLLGVKQTVRAKSSLMWEPGSNNMLWTKSTLLLPKKNK